MTLDRLNYVLGLDTGPLQKGITDSNRMFNSLLGNVSQLAVGIGAAFSFTAIIRNVQNLYKEFDHAMRQVWTLLDVTETRFKHISEQVLEMSKSAPYSAKELADGLYEIVSAGVEADNAMTFLEKSMHAAMAGASDLFTATDGLTTIMNAWQLEMEDLDHVMDVVFNTIKYGKTYFNELASYIGTVAPTAALAGVSLDELMSAAATLTKTGLKTRRAMTGLNYAVQSVIKPTEKAKKIADELGISFDTTTLKTLGFANFLEYVGEAADHSQEKLANLFGSVEASRAIFTLLGSGNEEFHRILSQTQDISGFTEIFQKHYDFVTFEQIRGEAEDTIGKLRDFDDKVKGTASTLSDSENAFLSLENFSLDLSGITSTLDDLTESSGQSKTSIEEVVQVLGKIGSSLDVSFDDIVKALMLPEDSKERLNYQPIYDALASVLRDSETSVSDFQTLLRSLNENPTFDFTRLGSAVNTVISTSETDIKTFKRSFEQINDISFDFTQVLNSIETLRTSKQFTNTADEIMGYLTVINDVGKEWSFPNINKALGDLVTATGGRRDEIMKVLEKIDETPEAANLPEFQWLVNPLDKVAAKYETKRDTLIDLILEVDNQTDLDFLWIAEELAKADAPTQKVIEEIQAKIEDIQDVNMTFGALKNTISSLKDTLGVDVTVTDIRETIEGINEAKLTDSGKDAFPFLIQALSEIKGNTGDTVKEILKNFEEIDTTTYEFKGIKESYAKVLTNMGTTNEDIKALIEQVQNMDDDITFAELIEKMVEVQDNSITTAENVQDFVEVIYQTAQELGMTEVDAMDKVNTMVDKTKTSTDAATRAYKKTADSIKNLQDRARDSFQSIGITIGRFIEPLTRTLSGFAENMGKWATSMSRAEGVSLGLSSAIAGAGGLVMGLSGLVKVVTNLLGSFGIWGLAITGIAAAVAGLITVMGTLSYKGKETTQVLEGTAKILQRTADVDLYKLTLEADEAARAFKDIKANVEDVTTAQQSLIAKVEAYNAAQETSVAEADSIKQEIDEILEMYPQFKDMVIETNDGLEVQYDTMVRITEEMEAQLLSAKIKSDEATKALVNELALYDRLHGEVEYWEKQFDSLMSKDFKSYGLFTFREELVKLMKELPAVKDEIDRIFATGEGNVQTREQAEEYYFSSLPVAAFKEYEEAIEEAAKNTIEKLKASKVQEEMRKTIQEIFGFTGETADILESGKYPSEILELAFNSVSFQGKNESLEKIKQFSEITGIAVESIDEFVDLYRTVNDKEFDSPQSFYDVLDKMFKISPWNSQDVLFGKKLNSGVVKELLDIQYNLSKSRQNLEAEAVNYQFAMINVRNQIANSFDNLEFILKQKSDALMMAYDEFLNTEPTQAEKESWISKYVSETKKEMDDLLTAQNNLNKNLEAQIKEFDNIQDRSILLGLLSNEWQSAKEYADNLEESISDIEARRKELEATQQKLASQSLEDSKYDKFNEKIKSVNTSIQELEQKMKVLESPEAADNIDYISSTIPSLRTELQRLDNSLMELDITYSGVFSKENLENYNSFLEENGNAINTLDNRLKNISGDMSEYVASAVNSFRERALELKDSIKEIESVDALQGLYLQLDDFRRKLKEFEREGWFTSILPEGRETDILKETFDSIITTVESGKREALDAVSLLSGTGESVSDVVIQEFKSDVLMQQLKGVMQEVTSTMTEGVTEVLGESYSEFQERIQEILQDQELFKEDFEINLKFDRNKIRSQAEDLSAFLSSAYQDVAGLDLNLSGLDEDADAEAKRELETAVNEAAKRAVSQARGALDQYYEVLEDSESSIANKIQSLNVISQKLAEQSDKALAASRPELADEYRRDSEYFSAIKTYIETNQEWQESLESNEPIFNKFNQEMAMLKEQYQLGKISIHEYTMATDNLRALYSSALSDLSANVSNVITQTKNLITSTKELEDAGIETGISVDDLTKRLERWSQIEIDLSEDIEQIINFRTAMGVMAEYEKQAALAGNDMIAVFNLTQDALDKLREQELDLKLENNFKGAQIVSEMIQDLEYRVETLLPLIDELKQKLQEKSEIQGLKDNIEALARTKEAMDKFGSSGSAYRDLLSDLSGALDTLIFKAKMFQLGSPEELATWELMLEKIQAMEAEQQSEMFEEDVKQRENIISYYEQENIGLERRKSLYQGIISDYEKEIEAKVSSLDYDKETVEELKKQKEEYGILLELIEDMIDKQNALSNEEQAQEKLETLEAQLRANRDEQDAVKELNLDAEMQNQLLREELSILEEIVILVQMAGLDLNIDEQLAKITELRGQLKDTAADAKTWQDSIREQERLLAFYNQSPESEEKVNKIKGIYESMKNIIENQIEDLVKAGDANSAMIPVLQEKLALYDAELASINQQEDAHEAALEKQKNALQMQADQYNTLMGAVANGFSQFGETGQLISNILGEMKFKVEELEDGTSRLVSPFEDMEGLIANIGTQLAVFGIEQVMTLAANLLYTFQEVKRIQGDLNKWEYDTRDLNKMLQDFRNFEQNKQALSDKMFELPFAKFLDAITFGLFGFSQGVEDEISELKEKLDITFNDLAGALGMSIEDIMGSLEDAFSEDTYEGFLKSFTTSLEEMTRQALIRAFLSEAIQPIIEDYVKAFIEMYEAGTLSPEEVAKWREKLESAIDSSGLEEFFNVIQDYFDDMSGYGSEFSGADAISRSITEETGNRLAALLTTINMHVASIDQFLENGILTVRVVNQETSSRNDEDSLAAMGV